MGSQKSCILTGVFANDTTTLIEVRGHTVTDDSAVIGSFTFIILDVHRSLRVSFNIFEAATVFHSS